ncbi:MAG: prolyl oligopeptidase family serine peptidase [Kiritimatiellaeota bacterium]|nr:prolyl oligopeptidase family serine peptidase [Kiritimatiellota bacterium]
MNLYINWKWSIGLLAAVCILPCGVAQQQPGRGPGGGPPPMVQDFIQKLAAVHAQPSSKSQMLEQMKSWMTQHGGTDVDTKLAGIGQIFDQASTMSAADFQKNQQDLAWQIFKQMRGPPPGRAGPAASAGAGSQQGQPRRGPEQLPPGTTVQRDVEYVAGGGKSQALDLYVPENADGMLPVIIFIHGGGWRSGSKDMVPALSLLPRGYAIASIEYRFSDKALWPAQLDDCKAAIRWLRTNAARYHLDAHHLGAWGSSSGGQLAAMLGVTGDKDSRVQAVYVQSGTSDLVALFDLKVRGDNGNNFSPIIELLGGPGVATKEKARQASPITYVSRNAAPFLIMHGDRDPIVPVQQGETLDAALHKVGAVSKLVIVAGARHGVGGPDVDEQVAVFFDQYLKPGKTGVSTWPKNGASAGAPSAAMAGKESQNTPPSRVQVQPVVAPVNELLGAWSVTVGSYQDTWTFMEDGTVATAAQPNLKGLWKNDGRRILIQWDEVQNGQKTWEAFPLPLNKQAQQGSSWSGQRLVARKVLGASTAPVVGLSTSNKTSPGEIQWIDVHNHFYPDRNTDFSESVRVALAAMDQAGISKKILLPPPSGVRPDVRFLKTCQQACRSHRDRFAFGCCADLNTMINNSTNVSVASRHEFEHTAEAIARQGACSFGEMFLSHLLAPAGEKPLCFGVEADHPLLLVLADVSAHYGVPIDVHFDLIAEDHPGPEHVRPELVKSFPNLFRNKLPAFERLLAHNPQAKICWQHAGSDWYGYWTVDLSRRLLQQHPNLYMALGFGRKCVQENAPLSDDQQLRPEWLRLFREFPDRFVIGSDSFIHPNDQVGGRMTPPLFWTRRFLNVLPPDLAPKIACENAIALFKLKN